MPATSREEIEEMMRRWLAVNARAEREGDWRCLADYFTENCLYGWDTPNGRYAYRGREAIRETCVGVAMDPYRGWTYPYDKIVLDEHQGEAFVTWWQVPPGAPRRADGSEMKVIGASWFRYGGGYQWSEQRDLYDYAAITSLVVECVETGVLAAMPLMSAQRVSGGGEAAAE